MNTKNLFSIVAVICRLFGITLAIMSDVEIPAAWLNVVIGVVIGGWSTALFRQTNGALA